ncbi:MAG: MarR family winged helix-turn-helix transcriptional regulator [Streptosporangiales bacterium]
MRYEDCLALSTLLIGAAGTVVDRIQAGMAARGYDDVRPAHGFAFVRLSPGGATAGELAKHLGVSKQAASQLVDELVRKGYVERQPHPTDARARLVVLTARGRACTRAAEETAAEAARPWVDVLGSERTRALRADLERVVPPGPLRPSW